MAGNNVEEISPTTSNEITENVDDQQTSPNNAEIIHSNEEQLAKDEPKNTDNKELDRVDKSKRSAKILLIFVNVCTLICSIVLFVVGVMMTVNHAKIHEEWHAGYGFWNASIICIVISLVLAGLGSIGE